MSILSTVASYLHAGLCVLPADIAAKRPRLPSWREYQSNLPTVENLTAWFFDAGQAGACIITGAVSGNLEMIDFDAGGELFAAWAQIVSDHDPELLASLVIEKSKSGGKHVVYRCQDTVEGNQKLAQRTLIATSAEPIMFQGKQFVPRKAGDHFEAVVTLIETRGEGGLFLCAPSPGYEVESGSFLDIPTITADQHALLLRAAASLTEVKPQVVPTPRPLPADTIAHRPGDDYARRGDVAALLIKHGWKITRGGDNESWRRPGKEKGISATRKDGVFYVFSSNALPFEPDKGYGPFGVYTLLEHGGDYAKASRALRAEGFGTDPDAGPAVDLSAIDHPKPPADAEEDEQPAASNDPTDPGSFPEKLLQVPGFISEVIAYNLATAIRQQPVLALAGAIALQAVLAARKVKDARGNRTNVYLIANAGAGKGKDHARKINREILHDAGLAELEGNEEIASDAGLMGMVETTPGLLLQVDEFGRFLQTAGDPRKAPHLYSILTLLMKLYSSADTVFKGKAYANSKQNKVINQPCVTLMGTTVPESFYESLTANSLQDGFMARMMVFDGLAKATRQHVERAPVPKSILDQAKYWGSLTTLGGGQGNLHAINPAPGLIITTPEARAVFDTFGAIADAEVDVDRVGQSLWARAEEKACRLALIYACSADATQPVIDEAAATWACDLAAYTTRWIIWRANHWVSENPFDAKQKKIIRIIQSCKGQITKSDLYLRTRGLTMKEREETLHNMLSTGQIHADTISTNTKTRTIYRLAQVAYLQGSNEF